MSVTKTRREEEAALSLWDDGPCGFDAGDANLRRVVGNDPTNATDPTGLYTQYWWQDLGETFGIITGRPLPQPLVPVAQALQDANRDAYNALPKVTYHTDTEVIDGKVVMTCHPQSLAPMTPEEYRQRIDTINAIEGVIRPIDAYIAGWASSLFPIPMRDGSSAYLDIRERIYGNIAAQDHQGVAFQSGQLTGVVHNIAMAAGGGADALTNLPSLSGGGLAAGPEGVLMVQPVTVSVSGQGVAGLGVAGESSSALAKRTNVGGGSSSAPTSRSGALDEAKDRLGVPRSQQLTRQWRIGDPADVQGSGVRDPNPRNQGIIYEYEIPKSGGGTQKVYVIDHPNDPLHGGTGHVHTGIPKPGASSVEPGGRYTEIGEPIPYRE